eukprot:XP_008189050.1 PREDICTED: uncharacterized protein LOC103311248 [Acyrthosiphon pisum]
MTYVKSTKGKNLCTYVKSTKGKNLLVHAEYIFEKDYTKNEKTYWKCIKYNMYKCRGRAHTVNDEVILHKNTHNHTPNIIEISTKTIINELKKTASSQVSSTPHQIVTNTISTISSQAISGALPSVATMKKTVQRLRRCENAPPVNPSTGPDDVNRILLFSTEENLKILSDQYHWFIDGTFESSPQLFTQLLTIHAIKYDTVLPLVFALVPNKTRGSYTKIINELLNLEKNLRPASVMVDFEQALLGAITDVFKDTRIRGCFFHFGQCIWRKIQCIPEIREKYISNADFALNVKQLMALAFVPIPDVEEKFDELMSQRFFVENEELLFPLTDYFEDTWIGRPNRRRTRRPPTFSLALWNQYDATLADLPKTNNSVEGWHRAFSSLLGASHPTIWRLIDTIKKEQGSTEIKINQLIAGQEQVAKKKKYTKTTTRIKKIVNSYHERNLNEYLIGIAHNLQI